MDALNFRLVEQTLQKFSVNFQKFVTLHSRQTSKKAQGAQFQAIEGSTLGVILVCWGGFWSLEGVFWRKKVFWVILWNAEKSA